MLTKTIIHAGPYKTGTSAIQKSYALNPLKIFLKQCPLILPRESYANRITISDPRMAKKIESLCIKVMKNNTVVISDEGMFMNNHLVFMEEFRSYVEAVHKNLHALNPVVVWYVREPVAWLRSLFVEGNYLGKISMTQEQWLERVCSQLHLNPMEQIKTIESFFGEKNVIAVPYNSGQSISSFSKILEQAGVPNRYLVKNENLVNQNIYSSKTLATRSKHENVDRGSPLWKRSSNFSSDPHAGAGCMELAHRKEELVEAYAQLAKRASSNGWGCSADSFTEIGQQLSSRSSGKSIFFEATTNPGNLSQLKFSAQKNKRENSLAKMQLPYFIKRIRSFFTPESLAFRMLTRKLKPWLK